MSSMDYRGHSMSNINHRGHSMNHRGHCRSHVGHGGQRTSGGWEGAVGALVTKHVHVGVGQVATVAGEGGDCVVSVGEASERGGNRSKGRSSMKHRSHVGHGGQGTGGGGEGAVGALVPGEVGARHAEAVVIGDVVLRLDVAVGVDVAEGAAHVAVGVAALLAGGVAGVVAEGVLSELVLRVVLGLDGRLNGQGGGVRDGHGGSVGHGHGGGVSHSHWGSVGNTHWTRHSHSTMSYTMGSVGHSHGSRVRHTHNAMGCNRGDRMGHSTVGGVGQSHRSGVVNYRGLVHRRSNMKQRRAVVLDGDQGRVMAHSGNGHLLDAHGVMGEGVGECHVRAQDGGVGDPSAAHSHGREGAHEFLKKVV